MIRGGESRSPGLGLGLPRLGGGCAGGGAGRSIKEETQPPGPRRWGAGAAAGEGSHVATLAPMVNLLIILYISAHIPLLRKSGISISPLSCDLTGFRRLNCMDLGRSGTTFNRIRWALGSACYDDIDP